MIRVATESDINAVLDMALKFVKNTGYKDIYNEYKVTSMILYCMEHGIVLMHDYGFVMGLADQFIYGSTSMATELAWWVDPDHRGDGVGKELLEGFESWAKSIGCSYVTMISIDDNVGKYYEKKGYKLYERAYMKELN